jgi:hypothetical protein
VTTGGISTARHNIEDVTTADTSTAEHNIEDVTTADLSDSEIVTVNPGDDDKRKVYKI